MDSEKLRRLLSQEESATVEFKREPYRIDSTNAETKKRQRHELIKDILALANGNSVVAGETAYLIIGADDHLDLDGNRQLHDIGEEVLTSKRILDIVNPACAPHIEDLISEIVPLDGKRLNAITILPTPHLYEITQRLEPSTSGPVTEYTVFTRHNAGIQVASAKERDAIARLKRSRFNEMQNPPPEPFGAAVGAIIGAAIASDLGQRITDRNTGKAVWGATGTLVGGFSGWLMGLAYRRIRDIQSDLSKLPPAWQLPVAGLLITWVIGFWAVVTYLLGKKRS